MNQKVTPAAIAQDHARSDNLVLSYRTKRQPCKRNNPILLCPVYKETKLSRGHTDVSISATDLESEIQTKAARESASHPNITETGKSRCIIKTLPGPFLCH